MKEMFKNFIGIITISLIITSCGGGGDDGPPPPPPNEPPSVIGEVIFPTANLLCIDNNITFDWEDATDPEGFALSYQIVIARDRDLTMIEEDRTVSESEVTIELETNTAFYWNVTAIDPGGLRGETSETLAFFTMGEGETNHVPFTAALVGPEDEANVDASASLTLTWDGADTDEGDTLTYDVFFGTDPNPPALGSGTGISEETINVDASTPATTYYWRVNTTDDSGATSIGTLWEFTTN